MNVLITGGAGFIGSHVADELLRRGHRVTALDSLDSQVHPRRVRPRYLDRRVRLQVGDVTKPGDVRKALQGAAAVVHFAARVGVGQSQYEVDRYVRTNDVGTGVVLQGMLNLPSRRRPRRMVVAGSMSAYGEGLYRCATCGPVQPNLRSARDVAGGRWDPRCPNGHGSLTPVPTTEDTPRRGASVYALTKSHQEDLVLAVCGAHAIPAMALRFFNVYGPRQALGNPYTGVAAIFLARLRNRHRPVVYEDGRQTRDFVAVEDVARAVADAVESDASGAVCNVGSGAPIAIADLALALARAEGTDIAPEIAHRFRSGDVRHCTADIANIRSVLGWKPRITLAKGLKALAEATRNEKPPDQFSRAAAELRRWKLA